jgi:MtrB/PioB family decaheme-associated outer membrane protein
MNHQPAKPVSFAVFLALLLCVQTRADESPVREDTSGWLCNFCNYPQGWFGTFDIGPGYANEASLKFADYRGITEKGAFVSINGDMHYLDADGRYFDLYARHLGIDSRQLEMRGGRRGRIEFRLAYREIPKYRGYGTQTPFRGTGTDKLWPPPDWVKSRTTSGMSALDASLNPVTLETKRKIFEAGLSFRMTGNWRYEADFQHTEKNGTRAFGAGVFTIQSSHFPAPVDFSVNRVDMGIEYSNKRSRMRFGFSGSSFNNRYASISWENPFTPVGNTANLRAALEPDSNFYQLNFTGSFRPNTRVHLSAQASIGRITQDVEFIAYSINPDFDDLEPPLASLNGELHTSSLGAKMTARLSPKLKLFLGMKYDDRDNRTPTDFYTPVITDLVLREETPNRPYSFKRSQYSAQVSYRTYTSVNFNAGAKQKNDKRTLQSVRETKDSTWWGEVSIDHWSAAQLRVRLETAARDISPYQQVGDPGLRENILMRKFHLADRDRDRLLIELDLSPGDRVSAGLSYFVARDRYAQSILGLMESNEHSVNLDLGFSIQTNLGLHAFVALEDYDSDIASAEYASAAGWTADTKDRFTTWGFGLNGQLTDKLDISIDYVSSHSRGRIVTDSSAGEPPFPDLTTDLRNANIRLNYRASKQWGLSLKAEHENYDSSDWQIDGLGNDGISAILTLGPISPNYSVTVFRLLANYTF